MRGNVCIVNSVRDQANDLIEKAKKSAEKRAEWEKGKKFIYVPHPTISKTFVQKLKTKNHGTRKV